MNSNDRVYINNLLKKLEPLENSQVYNIQSCKNCILFNGENCQIYPENDNNFIKIPDYCLLNNQYIIIKKGEY